MFIYRKAFTSSIFHHPCSWKTCSFIFQGRNVKESVGGQEAGCQGRITLGKPAVLAALPPLPIVGILLKV